METKKHTKKTEKLLCCLFLLLPMSAAYSDENNTESVQQEFPKEIIEEQSKYEADSNEVDDPFEQEIERESLALKLMPKYGNWCGANYPKDMSTADEPIDLLDAACKTHDYCYENKGYLNCSCDNDINQELIAGLKERKFERSEAFFARTIHHYFNGSPCNGDHSTKIGPSRAAHGILKNVGGKVVNVIKKLPVIGSKLEVSDAE